MVTVSSSSENRSAGSEGSVPRLLVAVDPTACRGLPLHDEVVGAEDDNMARSAERRIKQSSPLPFTGKKNERGKGTRKEGRVTIVMKDEFLSARRGTKGDSSMENDVRLTLSNLRLEQDCFRVYMG